jgi:hypothetical protein
MENNFVNSVYCKAGKYDFIVADLGFNVEETIKWLESLREYAKENKGIVDAQILRSKKDPNKFYMQYRKWEKKPEVKAVQQMPDREHDDLPF